MLRIVATLTVVLIVVAGCSPRERSTSDNARQAPAASSDIEQPGGQQLGDVAQAPGGDASGVVADNQKKMDAASAESQPEKKPEPLGVPDDPETRAVVFENLEAMGSDAAVERRAASDVLDALGEAGIPFVVLGLCEGTPLQKRGAATYLIGRVSPRDTKAVAALISTLAAEDESLRRASLQAVEKLDEQQLAEALPALIAYAENQAEAEAYRSRAIRAITKLGPRGEVVAKNLIQLARNDPSMNVRRACFFAIVKVAPAQMAEEFLQTQLATDPTADLRRLAAKWLATVARSEKSLQCLVDALRDPEEPVRLEAVDSLVAIGKPSLPGLIKAMEASDVRTRRHATLAVGKLGLMAADAQPALEKRLDDPDQQVRDLATAALQSLK